jgi:hypothetical protein
MSIQGKFGRVGRRGPVKEGTMRKAVCVAVVCAAAMMIGSSRAPALAQPYPPTASTLTISSSVVTPGETLTVSGQGANAGASVTITLASTPRVVATTKANGSGTFRASFQVPTDEPQGQHTVTATNSGRVLGSVTIRVVAARQGGGHRGALPADGNGLPFTGANALPEVATGAGLILAGIVLLLAIRRRRAGRST